MNCINCGKELIKYQKKFCSLRCSAKAQNRIKKEKPVIKCNKCGKELVKYQKKFCSLSCSSSFNGIGKVRNTGKKKIKICSICGKDFSSKNKFCSKECYANHRILQQQFNLENQLIKSPSTLKNALLKDDSVCAICGGEQKWKGKKLVLILDHIDGNSDNNCVSNLRFVCPNCDSQLDTYKSKNKNSGRHYRLKRRNNGKSF